MSRILPFCLLVVLTACGTTASSSAATTADVAADSAVDIATADASPDVAATGTDFNAQASDFTCIQKGTKIRNFYLTNPLGNLDAAVAVANNAAGGQYPVGTIIQLIPNEAMVKRFKGFSATSDDWEFFSLSTSASGTQILQRGTTAVVNQFGGNCFDCHSKADAKFDLICEETHGCAPLPFTADTIAAVQSADPRCP